MRQTLTALDFVELVTVDKHREEWTVPGQVVAAFDTVTDAGCFVEFEFKGQAESTDEAIERLQGSLPVSASISETGSTKGYPHMLLNR